MQATGLHRRHHLQPQGVAAGAEVASSATADGQGVVVAAVDQPVEPPRRVVRWSSSASTSATLANVCSIVKPYARRCTINVACGAIDADRTLSVAEQGGPHVRHEGATGPTGRDRSGRLGRSAAPVLARRRRGPLRARRRSHVCRRTPPHRRGDLVFRRRRRPDVAQRHCRHRRVRDRGAARYVHLDPRRHPLPVPIHRPPTAAGHRRDHAAVAG